MTMLALHKSVAWALENKTTDAKMAGYYTAIGLIGTPNIIGQLRNGKILALITLNTGEKPSGHQQDFIQLIANNNGVSGYCYNAAQAKNIIDGAQQ